MDIFKSPINPFHATDLFWYPLKTESQRFSDVFKGYQKRLEAWNWLSSSKFLFVFFVHSNYPRNLNFPKRFIPVPRSMGYISPDISWAISHNDPGKSNTWHHNPVTPIVNTERDNGACQHWNFNETLSLSQESLVKLV